MRRNLKRLGCTVLCACLLMINTPAPMSYAGNLKQYATDTDATETDAAYTEAEETNRTATGTDAEDISAKDAADINTSSVMGADVLLYATSPDVPADGYKLEINSQADWDALFNHTAGDGSGWSSSSSSGITATYNENKNPVVISLNTDITLSQNTTLTVPPIDATPKDFRLYGNGHSVDTAGHTFNLIANTVTIRNTHIKNGKVQVQNHIDFRCLDSQFTNASVELYTNGITERTYITGCEFSDCLGPCINSKGAPCPVSFSDCNMDNSGLLFTSANPCRVSFHGITATNCTGTVLKQTANGSYVIESISDCEFSTLQSGFAAIEYIGGTIGEITDCTITGFDTGINLESSNAAGDIDTLTISNIWISNCITGLRTDYVSGYDNVEISNLHMLARSGDGRNSVGYVNSGHLTKNVFSSTTCNFSEMPQITDCSIAGFDTGIDLSTCSAFISNCNITDCISGIKISGDPTLIADTTLESRSSVRPGSDNAGVTTNAYCYLVDCDINNFYIGSDMHASSIATIIGCRYKNNTTNLIGAFTTSAHDTSFTGGETSVIIRSGKSYFYDCVVKGDAATTSGFSMEASATNLYIYSQERPYDSPSPGYYYYDIIKQYSDRTVTNGKSEISNCVTGIDSKNTMYIADTHIHDCVTGVKSTANNAYTYGNNLIEDCTDGMIMQSLYKYGTNTTFTDSFTDTIRNCSNNGIESYYIYSDPQNWINRLEIYNCGNHGIHTTGNVTTAAVDIHDCKIGVYMTDNANNVILSPEAKIYNNLEWNIYDNSTNNYAQFIISGSSGSSGTLTKGGIGNIYSIHNPIIDVQELYSDDSVYYLGTEDGMYRFNVRNLNGTVVIDTIDSGYTIGRKVAVLSTDITSQMFAKKEGFVISPKVESGNTYAVFAAGCDVTYDVTTNGGDTFNDGSQTRSSNTDEVLTRISYLQGDDIDLSYTASKTGYEFVGWNTDPDATEGLDTLSADRTDITLYAIYKKTAYINYHTYDAASDYRTAVTFYNNEDGIEHELAAYNAGGSNTFTGYVLDEDAAISSADDVITEGSDVTVSPDGLDVYCVYEKQGQLDYLKKDGSTLSTERSTVYQISSDNKNFVYTIKAGEPVEGFTFKEWKDGAGNSYAAGSTLSTKNSSVVLKPVYVVYEEPTTEEPTTEEPSTGEPDTPTTEAPAPDAPIIETPTTETATQTPAGPKTGDSTAPIAVMILGFLSLLGMLGLSMKDKRKN